MGALDHLWLHFPQMGDDDVPVIVKGDGCYLEDQAGRRYLDALAGLFCVNAGYGFGEEMGEGFSDLECNALLRGFVSPRLFERGLICRADDRGDPVLQISPPLVAGQEEFDLIAGTLGEVLEEASSASMRLS
jgi:adenosylmethionine-8-amino-7-oxononanoate aminotransferase